MPVGLMPRCMPCVVSYNSFLHASLLSSVAAAYACVESGTDLYLDQALK